MPGTALDPANDYDVVIIGYGPVGVTAANLLGARGLRVLVVERDADIYARARAISTDEEVVRVWQRIGLADRLVEDMLVGRDIDFVDTRGRSFLSFAPATRGNGHPTQAFIYQPDLERVLREGADRYPNVEVRLRTEVIDHRQDDDGVEVLMVDLDDEMLMRTRASYVIAADGGSSPTRGRLGIGFEGRTHEDRWLVIDTKVRQAWPEVDRLRFHCNPARPAVDCPTPLGHHRWEFPVLPGDDAADLASEPTVRRLLADQGIGADQVEVLRTAIYSHHIRFATRWRDGRVFLVGDAAHDPAFRIAMRTPGVGSYLRSGRWMPDSHYHVGLLSPDRGRSKVVGSVIAQPWVQDASGRRGRLDDALGSGWAVLHRGPTMHTPAIPGSGRAGAEVHEVLPAASTPRCGRRAASVVRPARCDVGRRETRRDRVLEHLTQPTPVRGRCRPGPAPSHGHGG